MENTNQKKLIYQYGLLSGAVAVAFEIMRFSMGIHYVNDGISTLVWMLILFGGVLAGSLAVKNNNSGLISLNQTLKSGVGIALIYTLVILIWTAIMVNVLEPTFWDTAYEVAYEVTKEQDPEAMGNVSFEDFKPFVTWLQWGVYPIIIASRLFFGFIFSLVVGIVIKKSE